jgi:lysophospholipase L1-like esterase
VDRFNPEALEAYRRYLRETIRLCRSHGVRPLLAEPPFDLEHLPPEGLREFGIRYTPAYFLETARRYFDTMREVAAEEGVPLLRHSLGLARLRQRSLFLDTLHPTAEGNRRMAADLAGEIRKIPGILHQ